MPDPLTTFQQTLLAGARELGLTITDTQLALLTRHYQLLLAQRTHRLTAITDPTHAAIKHFLDSLTALLIRDIRPGERVADIGSGAGFPGLPLAIVRPGASYTLVESNQRRAAFLREAAAALALPNVTVIADRAETLSRDAPIPPLQPWRGGQGVRQSPDSAVPPSPAEGGPNPRNLRNLRFLPSGRSPVPLVPSRPLRLCSPRAKSRGGERCSAVPIPVHQSLPPEASAKGGSSADGRPSPTHRESYDLVIARALAPLPVLFEYCLPLVRVGGDCLALKGPAGERELARAQHALTTLGGQLTATRILTLPQSAGARFLILITKLSPTPTRYPRRPGIPAKRPL